MKARKVYIIQTKWERYPYIWVNLLVYKRRINASKKILKLMQEDILKEYRIVERVMF